MKFLALTVLAIISVTAHADNDKAKQMLADATKLYDDRENSASLDQAKSILDQALTEASDSELKYDILILDSRVVYYMGTKTNGNDAKLAVFETAYKMAEQAKSVDDTYAEAYYYYAIALARWAEAKGVMASLGRKKELMENLDAAMARTTRNADEGTTIDGWGPSRVYGRMFFKLPGLAGGSTTKSIQNLNEAVAHAKNYAINVNYLAETLMNAGSDNWQKGCNLLNELLANDEKTYNTARLPETVSEFADARALKATYNCN